MNEIPERAAWLDHPIEWVNEASSFEVERLGLGNAEFVLLDQHVGLSYDPQEGSATIVIRDIQVVSMDEINRRLSYRVIGASNFEQPWDLGGANLASVGAGIGAGEK